VAELTHGLGTDYFTLDIMLKRYACHITAHNPVEAAVELRKQYNFTAADVSVRAGADEMHIRLKSRGGHHFEALSVYHYLRHVLIERNLSSGGDDGHHSGAAAAA
jgi:hypothetical protein